jgi:hypothetical protein
MAMKKNIRQFILWFSAAFTFISLIDDLLWIVNFRALNFQNPWERFVLPIIATVCINIFSSSKQGK